jgi:hypothetical protein
MVLDLFGSIEDMRIFMMRDPITPIIPITPITPVSAKSNSTRVKPETALEDLQRKNHNNDSQNVHDSHVNHSLAKKYDRLYELHIEQNKDMHTLLPELGINIDEMQELKIQSTLSEIRTYAVSRSNEANLKKIDCVLNEIQKGGTITSISNAVDESGTRIAIAEDWILTLAWERIHSQDNALVQDSLKESLYDQLVDATYVISEHTNVAMNILRMFFDGNITDHEGRDIIRPVCINGRVARILSAFTLIDVDSILSEPEKDDKEIANIAYTKANHIIEQELDSYGNNIKQLYSKRDDELSAPEQETVRRFTDHVKQVMAETLRRDYEDSVDEKLLMTIISNSIAVV